MAFREDFEIRVSGDSSALDRMADALRQSSSATDALGDAARRSERSIRDVDDALDRLDTDADAARRSVDDLGTASSDASKDTKQLGDESDDAGGKLQVLEGWAKKAVLALAGFAGIGAVSIGGLFTAGIGQVVAFDSAMNRFAAQTATYGTALEDYRDIAESVFTSGWGENFDDVAASMAQVRSITMLSGDALSGMTESALIFRDVFDRDITESVRAADTVMETFGVSGDQAFDILTTAMQGTGDPAQDLLDTFNEYAANFEDLGFTAEEMMAMLDTGLEGGARNTDDIADAMREFGIRLKDGTSKQAVFNLGLRDMQRQFERGEISGKDMFTAIQSELFKLDDPMQRNLLGVELFGTKWEDMGESVFANLDTYSDLMDQIDGSTRKAGDAMSQGLGPAWERFTRTIQVGLVDAIGPYAAALLNELTPALEAVGAWLASDGIPAFIDFSRKVIDAGTSSVLAILGFLGWDSVGDFLGDVANALGDIVGFIGSLSLAEIGLLGGAFALMSSQSIVGGLSAIGTTIAGWAGSLRAAWVSAGPLLLVFGLIMAYRENFGGLRDAINQVGEGIRDGDLKKALDGILDTITAIPLEIATWAGDQLGIDVPEGLQRWHDVWDSIKLLIRLAAQYVGDFIDKAAEFVVGDVWEGFKTLVENIKNFIGDIPNKIASFVASLAIQYPAVWDTFSGLVNGLKSVFEWISGNVSSIFSGLDFEIPGAFNDFLGVLNAIKKAANDVAGWLGFGGGGDDVDTMTLGAAEATGGMAVWPPTKDTGGPGFANQPVLIGRRAQPELFVPRTAGTFFPAGQYGMAAAGGSGGIVIQGDVHFHGVQDIRQMKRELEAEQRRQNERKRA